MELILKLLFFLILIHVPLTVDVCNYVSLIVRYLL